MEQLSIEQINKFFLNYYVSSTNNLCDTLNCKYGSAFFSGLSIKLLNIIVYYSLFNKEPTFIRCHKQYELYRLEGIPLVEFYDKLKLNDPEYISIEKKLDLEDITQLFFKEPIDTIEITRLIHFHTNYQFMDYSSIKFDILGPLISKYFTPSSTICDKIETLIEKYNIDFDNTCSIMYRGSDKICETNLPTYIEFLEKARLLKNKLKNNNLKFLLQTDEQEFIDTFLKDPEIGPLCFFFSEVPRIDKEKHSIIASIHTNKIENVSWYLASIIIMSKTNNIICTSDNGSLWITLFRNNAYGVYQYFNHDNHEGHYQKITGIRRDPTSLTTVDLSFFLK